MNFQDELREIQEKPIDYKEKQAKEERIIIESAINKSLEKIKESAKDSAKNGRYLSVVKILEDDIQLRWTFKYSVIKEVMEKTEENLTKLGFKNIHINRSSGYNWNGNKTGELFKVLITWGNKELDSNEREIIERFNK